MDPVRYPCTYEGGFKGMRSSPDAELVLTEDQFWVSRPKTLWARTHRIWAKWTAVTGLTVTDVAPSDDAEDGSGPPGAARVALTTRVRGTGVVVVPDADADELWAAFHDLADLAERFPRPAVDAEHDEDDQDDEGDERDEGDEGDGDDGDLEDDEGNPDGGDDRDGGEPGQD